MPSVCVDKILKSGNRMKANERVKFLVRFFLLVLDKFFKNFANIWIPLQWVNFEVELQALLVSTNTYQK